VDAEEGMEVRSFLVVSGAQVVAVRSGVVGRRSNRHRRMYAAGIRTMHQMYYMKTIVAYHRQQWVAVVQGSNLRD
jgi:hypothetical protein